MVPEVGLEPTRLAAEDFLPTSAFAALASNEVRGLEHAHDIVVPNGVVNTSPSDHVGLDQQAAVMGTIKGGKFVYLSR